VKDYNKLTPDSPNIDRRLDEWKRRLLDLGRRNPLLYFNQSRRTAIQITVPDVSRLFDRVLDGRKKLRFAEPLQATLLDLIATENSEQTHQETTTRPGELETTLDVADLQRKLNRLRKRAHESIEEQGINTLYLALGILQWQESASSEEVIRSPLILVPVTLRYERNKPFTLEGLDEDATDNAALRYRFEQDFHLKLPLLDDPQSLEGEAIVRYLSKVSKLVRARGWSVLEESWLSIFSFESLVLYRDIADHADLYSAHPILSWLAGDTGPQNIDLPSFADLDATVSPREVFPILDADDSQLEVILRARLGQNLVVHGPPGTGKSQTIANVIAQSVRDGKTVLFVSRKMAALEVVYDRLERAGLGDLCLEVHSHRANKKDVIRRLNASLERGPYPGTHVPNEFSQLALLRRQLNDYAKALRQPGDARGRCPYDIYGILARHVDIPDLRSPVTSGDAVDLAMEREEELRSAIGQVASSADVFDGTESHPWRGAALRRVSPDDRRHLTDALRGIRHSIADVQECWKTIEELTGLAVPDSLDSLSLATAIAGHLASTPSLPLSVSSLNARHISDISQKLRFCFESAQEMARAQTEYSSVFTDAVFDLPVAELAERYATAYRAPVRLLKPSYRRDSAQLKTVSASGKPVDYRKALNALASCAKYKSHRERLQGEADSLREPLTSLVEAGADADWGIVESTIAWMDALLKMTGLDTLSPAFAEILAHRPDNARVEGRDASQKLGEASAELLMHVDYLEKVFPDGYDGLSVSAAGFDFLKEQAQRWLDSLSSLDDWASYRRAVDRCEATGLSGFLEDARRHDVGAETLAVGLEKALALAWVTEIQDRLPVLADFNSSEHERLRSEFRKLDKQLRQAAARVTVAAATASRPVVTEGASLRSPIGILRYQAQLQRRHQPLRKLLPAISSLLPTLKPCLLMSPLSVASYLPADTFQFDLVIFDEASQIPPEEAVGAIVRGRQLLVAGDERQLPPTSFFRAITADDYGEDDDEEDLTPPQDSILEQCIPLFPSAYLLWHYRSRHESLIAFSNREFYDGRLITFPSPEPSPEDAGVGFVHLTDGVFDRGNSRTNRGEARRVAEMVIDHLRNRPGRSLGVIAMSIQQQEAIEHELSRLRLENQDLEEAFSEERVEHFFAKNLERVQGDERDSLIISLGYGPDQQGVVRMQFGPLSRPGGQRRLNVAVTRGKIQTTLVSSLLPHHLDLSRLTSGSSDVAVLQRYLDYAAKGGRFPVDVATGQGEPESPFEEVVLERLRREGLEVDTQVGASSFRIDLAVRHPDRAGRYILGIECDGATFHRGGSARERDRLRQEVLEGLGWRIFRIWSPDWIRDANRVVSHIVERVNELRNSEEIGLPAGIGVVRTTHDTNSDEEGVLGNWRAVAETATSALKPLQSPMEELAEYETYKDERSHSAGSFYDDYLFVLSRMIAEIVKTEAPVHPAVVVQRVAGIYGFGRAGSIIRNRVFEAIDGAVASGEIKKRGDFLWRKDKDDAEPRRPKAGETPRTINEVALEEIAAASEWVLQWQISLPLDDLIRETARVLGYDRAGQLIQVRVRSAVKQSEKKQRIRYHNGSLSLISPATPARSRTKPTSGTQEAGERSHNKAMVRRVTLETSDRLTAKLRKLDLEIVDRRGRGGTLWVVGGPELRGHLVREGFKFAPGGGRATKNRPAWWLKGQQ